MTDLPSCLCDYPAEPERNVSGHREYCGVQRHIAREYNLERWTDQLLDNTHPSIQDQFV